MLKIRQEQIVAFEERGLKRLEKLMWQAWPEPCERLGESGVRVRIKKGFWKAKEYNIKNQNNITRFIHLMFNLDRNDLDTSPETPWVKSILNWGASEKFRLAALEKRAEREMEKKLGV